MRIVYRTTRSEYVGSHEYRIGKHDTTVLSFSAETECHPGIYAASLDWMNKNESRSVYAKCLVYDGDWTITAKGAIRCASIEVIGYVDQLGDEVASPFDREQ